MRSLLDDVAARAARYLESLGERPVAADPAAVAALESVLGGPLPVRGCDPAELVARLDEAGAPATVASAGPRYFGFVTGGALPAALAANWLAGAWDQNAFGEASSPLGAGLERIVLPWLRELLALPAESAGTLVTGATMANFAALAAARHAVLAQAGHDVERDGLFGAPPVTVVVGGEAHTTLFKALGLLGLGRERVVRVPVDGQGRMRADALPAFEPPAIVCLQAGNVNTGAFDPAAEICPRAREAGAWIHVDGAFGLWAAAAPQRAGLVAGFEAADSWAVDAHKWLNVPYDCGIAFSRDAAALRAAMSVNAAYLVLDERHRDPIDYTPESSRRMRAAEVWAAIASLGRDGIAELIERDCRLASSIAELLREAGFEVLNEVRLNQVLVRFGPPEVTRAVIAAVQAEGTCWAGPTEWQGHTAMRISVSSWATTAADAERSAEAIVRVARGTLTG